jgi:predicted nucleotidyltransferase
MYCPEERELFFSQTVNMLKSSEIIEGIVQLGSGVIGYKDEYSDIDLMVSTEKADDVGTTKKFIHQCFRELNSLYIKEIKFRENIFLIIAFMENGLEFNVSILPTELLNVKSTLWNVIFDRTGKVSEKMNRENENFEQKHVKYYVSDDIGFEFVYSMRKFHTELKRHNIIYALKMLETMRDYTLEVQAMNENKKLHQFKAYETLNFSFVEEYLLTYPKEITSESIAEAAAKLKKLFDDVVKKSSIHSMDNDLLQLLK